jgi:hypothetical protein
MNNQDHLKHIRLYLGWALFILILLCLRSCNNRDNSNSFIYAFTNINAAQKFCKENHDCHGLIITIREKPIIA